VTKNIRSLITTPLYHAGTAVGFSPCLLLGGTAILMKKFDPEGWLALIEKERANWAFAVPTIFQKVLALPDEIKGRYNLSSMRVVISSAAPCPPEVKKAINALFMKQGAKGPVFHEYYGSSEGGLFTILVPEDYIANEQRYASVGKARAAEVIVVDKETGRLLGPYEEGLVLIRSAATMALRYLGDEKKAHENIRVVSGKEYYDDGIVGYFDEDGFLYLSSRVKEMIITGGVNIYPNEIENAILTHPSVLDAAVIPVPHETLGEVAQACIQLKPGQTASKEQILEHLEKTGLSGFKLPQDIAILDELPRFIDGKIKKRILREAYWKGVKEIG
ncbi:MAG: AMP-binding protein, partial [Nitrospirota bacterium]|nr:AMP-binding protein [Nitrospirota bacterium]